MIVPVVLFAKQRKSTVTRNLYLQAFICTQVLDQLGYNIFSPGDPFSCQCSSSGRNCWTMGTLDWLAGWPAKGCTVNWPSSAVNDELDCWPTGCWSMFDGRHCQSLHRWQTLGSQHFFRLENWPDGSLESMIEWDVAEDRAGSWPWTHCELSSDKTGPIQYL